MEDKGSEDIRQQRKSPFKQFVQVNTSEDAKLARQWLLKESPTACLILEFLVDHMDHYNAIVCSYKVIQEYFGFSHPTVARAIKILKEHNFILVVKSGTSNVYYINKTLYWNSWGTNYEYAQFGAKILVSLSEQDKVTKQRVMKDLQMQRTVHLKGIKHQPPPVIQPSAPYPQRRRILLRSKEQIKLYRLLSSMGSAVDLTPDNVRKAFLCLGILEVPGWIELLI